MSLVLSSFMLVHTGFFDEFRGLLKTLYSIFYKTFFFFNLKKSGVFFFFGGGVKPRVKP